MAVKYTLELGVNNIGNVQSLQTTLVLYFGTVLPFISKDFKFYKFECHFILYHSIIKTINGKESGVGKYGQEEWGSEERGPFEWDLIQPKRTLIFI